MSSAKGRSRCLCLMFCAGDKVIDRWHGIDETDDVLQSSLYLGDLFLLGHSVDTRINAPRHQPVADEQTLPVMFLERLVVVQRNAAARGEDIELALQGFRHRSIAAAIPQRLVET